MTCSSDNNALIFGSRSAGVMYFAILFACVGNRLSIVSGPSFTSCLMSVVAPLSFEIINTWTLWVWTWIDSAFFIKITLLNIPKNMIDIRIVIICIISIVVSNNCTLMLLKREKKTQSIRSYPQQQAKETIWQYESVPIYTVGKKLRALHAKPPHTSEWSKVHCKRPLRTTNTSPESLSFNLHSY